MKITVEKAKKIILDKFPDSVINSVMDSPSAYIVSIQPKDWDENETLLDPFFKVSKKDGFVSEYSPVMDPEEFKKALQNLLYTRRRKAGE